MAGKAIMSHYHHNLGVNELWRAMMKMDTHCEDQSPAPALVDNPSGRRHPQHMNLGNLVGHGKLRINLHQHLQRHHQCLVLLLHLGEAHLVTAERRVPQRRRHVTDRNRGRYLMERTRRRDQKDRLPAPALVKPV